MSQTAVQRISEERDQLSEQEQSGLWAALDELTDPEIPVVTLREMGILRALRRGADGQVEVVITSTYSGCPAMEQISDDITSTLAREGVDGRVVTQLAPAWTTDWMTPEAREKLRAYGIAPPHTAPTAPGESVIHLLLNCELLALVGQAPEAFLARKLRWLARNAARTTPPRHRTLAPPRARRCTAAWIAWSRLTTSKGYDAGTPLRR